MHQPVEERPQVKFVRMVTGEDVLTEYEIKNNSTCFQNPLKVIYGLTPKQDGMIISLAQWVFDTICDKQTFEIKDDAILIVAEPTKEMTDYYWEAIDKNAGKKRKMQPVSNKQMQDDEFEEISEEEIEMIRTALEGAKEFKRKLH